jgi:hypothetical protein
MNRIKEATDGTPTTHELERPDRWVLDVLVVISALRLVLRTQARSARCSAIPGGRWGR